MSRADSTVKKNVDEAPDSEVARCRLHQSPSRKQVIEDLTGHKPKDKEAGAVASVMSHEVS